ncbi:hypothetical protein FRC15_004165 [Serendipita sp. 397]|nr:hypothetical protein FRC15_004165 [Serendipita sp. 397]
MADMEVDTPVEASTSAVGKKKKQDGPRFEVKKWNAVALWAWGERDYKMPVGPSQALTVVVRYRRRQLRNLQKSYYGSLHRLPGESSICYQR